MHTDYERAKAAIAYIADNAERQPTLAEVAAHVGLSPQHFQRLFGRWAGVSPKRFLQHLTAERAKHLLRESRPVLDAAFAVGLSSPARLHDLMLVTEAMTPGKDAARGAGLTIRIGVHDTPFGRCLAGVTERGLCALRFVDDDETETAARAELAREWDAATLVEDAAATGRLLGRIFDRVHQPAAPLHVLLRGTNFQLKVWEALLRVPEGCVVSYSDLASQLGTSRSTRAVAGAVAANPIAYLIPCHRVLRANGALGGYRWGLERKQVILEWEAAKTG